MADEEKDSISVTILPALQQGEVLKSDYLGDAVYAEWDGYQIKLFTSNGITAIDTIYLDPKVQVNLVRFIEEIVKGIR